MEHGIGRSPLPHLVVAGRGTGKGVMVRRLSVASPDSGAESPVYGAAPAGPAEREAPAARPSWGGGRRDWAERPMRRMVARDITVTAEWTLPGRAETGAAIRGRCRHVGHRPANRKVVCKGHPCIYAADGGPMTRFASPTAVPRGRRLPCKLTDVHGREG